MFFFDNIIIESTFQPFLATFQAMWSTESIFSVAKVNTTFK